MSGARPAPLRDGDFPVLVPITTRWADNDAFSHINNVAYYSFFDTAVNMWLVENGILDIASSPLVGLVVETGCRYRRPLAYPMTVRIGLRVARLGTSSVRYDVAAFDTAEEAAAEGNFTHVYVDRASGRPASIPEDWREKFRRIAVPATPS
ncbi:acyl-CoA thioesterase [Sabulicella glaciei]|uniref:Acyl-CoA thioesterase n=1 Tax=Sabulicella glaciei TaxID=2984948 RepID=A0ABT3NTE4_9PROT|nr:thioesterase family protein [Roseococcus sp. MDT2-1-1]MCW8085427.1 acyl-CoA thioesterase [Roseococcus sp. MDT2-1-1]